MRNKIFVCVVLFCSIYLCTMLTTPVLAATVDDARDMLGKDRIDGFYTKAEIDYITDQYNKIEKANLTAYLFELGNEIDMDVGLEDAYIQAEKNIALTKEAFEIALQTGSATEDVLANKSKYDVALENISGLRKKGITISIDYLENDWVDRYNEVQDIQEKMQADYDIGVIGKEMKLPLNHSFHLTSVFGYRLDPFTGENLEFHSGIDIGCPEGTYVYAQWNGIVTRVFEGETAGKAIEVTHGNGLRTLYMHLSEQRVSVGDEVRQYQLIALSGDTGRSTGPHLHLSIYLDDELVNPLYFYGVEGVKAFKTYVSNHPERNLEVAELEANVKDTPSKLVEDEEDTELKPQTSLILGAEAGDIYNGNEFGLNIDTFIQWLTEVYGDDHTQLQKEILDKALQEGVGG